MEITLEKKDSTNATIKVNLKQEDYQPKVREKLKEYSKKAQLKGFRPGKVPPALIQKMYGKSVLVDEINHLLIDTLNSYIKENNLPIIGDPIPDTSKIDPVDWDQQKDFIFNYDIGLVPDFRYELSKNVSLDKYLIIVDDTIVTETLENLKIQFGNSIEAENIIENDTVKGELTEEGGIISNITIILTKADKESIPQFLNRSKGDKITFEIENLFDDKAVLAHALNISLQEAEDKKGKAEMTIESIVRIEKAPVDQDFYDKIFGKDTFTTVESFMSKLHETINDNYIRETELLLKREIQKKLVENTSIELPNEFLKKWLFVSNKGKITPEQIEKEYDFYLKELKWTLIKNRIARDSDIKIENEDVLEKSKEKIKQQFGNMELGEEMEETLNSVADNYLKQDKGNNYYKLVDEILLERILYIALDKVNIIEKNISLEDFKKLV